MRLWSAILLTTSVALGTVWRVPEDCPTIQAGLETLSNRDTLSVAADIYHESLQAPAISFTVLGVVNPGGDPEKPVVDPSPLDSSTRLSCLTLPNNSRATIEDFIFHNGPEMFPRTPPIITGGIRNNSADLVTRRCTFDSTFVGIANPFTGGTGTLCIDDCDFTDNVNLCVYGATTGNVIIRGSTFSGTGDGLVRLRSFALVENCQFHSELYLPSYLWLSGSADTVRGCEFGPSEDRIHTAIITFASEGCLFEDNFFHDLLVSNAAVSYAGVSGETTYFLRNVFRNCQAAVAQTAGGGLLLTGQEPKSGIATEVVVDDGVFDSCLALTGTGWGAISMNQLTVFAENNDFDWHGVLAPTVANLACSLAVLHSSSFNHTVYALKAAYVLTMDARQNWWDHPTGPRHVHNPGLGDSVAGPVEFIPWLQADPLGVPEQAASLPTQMQLSVYPNPFNQSMTLVLAGFTGNDLEITLHNLLGQVVDVIHRGPLTGGQITYQAPPQLASGVYCLRASDHIAIQSRKVILMK